MASEATATAKSSRWRAHARLLLLSGWFLACLGPHILARAAGKSNWPRRFLAGAAEIAGADVRTVGPEPGRGHLILANHSSWLDILILAEATGCAFVSKAELGDHWFMRWLADQNATVYVNRADRRAVQGQAAQLREGLSHEKPLAIFPEGTVGDGRTLLSFKPALLSAVAPPPDGVKLVPVAIDYHDRAQDVAWVSGAPGLQDFLRVLGLSGRTPVTVRILDPLVPSGDRKALASAAQEAIEGALAASRATRRAL